MSPRKQSLVLQAESVNRVFPGCFGSRGFVMLFFQ